jgi:DNA-binding response OmpR family regulator
MQVPRTLIIEGEHIVRTAIRKSLSAQGYEVYSAATSWEGLQALERYQPAVVLLATHLPDGNGTTTCQQIRQKSTTPIVMLVDQRSETSIPTMFDAGATDYIHAPYEPSVLAARLRVARQQHSNNQHSPQHHYTRVGDLRFDYAQHRVYRGEREIMLTRTEWSLLDLLTNEPGHLYTYEQIIEVLRDTALDASHRKILHTFIYQLRRKIDLPDTLSLIETISGKGYRLRTVS